MCFSNTSRERVVIRNYKLQPMRDSLIVKVVVADCAVRVQYCERIESVNHFRRCSF